MNVREAVSQELHIPLWLVKPVFGVIVTAIAGLCFWMLQIHQMIARDAERWDQVKAGLVDVRANQMDVARLKVAVEQNTRALGAGERFTYQDYETHIRPKFEALHRMFEELKRK